MNIAAVVGVENEIREKVNKYNNSLLLLVSILPTIKDKGREKTEEHHSIS